MDSAKDHPSDINSKSIISLFMSETTTNNSCITDLAKVNKNNDPILPSDCAKKVDSRETNLKLSSQPRTATVPGRPRGATYDGNICMICNDRASGFHYGVLACGNSTEFLLK